MLRTWATDEERWVRRTAVVGQLGRRSDADTDLLRHAIDANVGDTTFWLRKAIGWVRAEVLRPGGRLSGLSPREALKHLSSSEV